MRRQLPPRRQPRRHRAALRAGERGRGRARRGCAVRTRLYSDAALGRERTLQRGELVENHRRGRAEPLLRERAAVLRAEEVDVAVTGTPSHLEYRSCLGHAKNLHAVFLDMRRLAFSCPYSATPPRSPCPLGPHPIDPWRETDHKVRHPGGPARFICCQLFGIPGRRLGAEGTLRPPVDPLPVQAGHLRLGRVQQSVPCRWPDHVRPSTSCASQCVGHAFPQLSRCSGG